MQNAISQVNYKYDREHKMQISETKCNALATKDVALRTVEFLTDGTELLLILPK